MKAAVSTSVQQFSTHAHNVLRLPLKMVDSRSIYFICFTPPLPKITTNLHEAQFDTRGDDFDVNFSNLLTPLQAQ